MLDKHTAELIAAGEVVERPASVVKELIENSIDAGAGRISVAIERGGVSVISVQDDGTGIEAEYLATAFIRHATSKIETEEDLTSIGTLGFRGEALASISSVSKVEVLTRTEADEFACLYRQQGGEELSAQAAARPVGTTITVRDLFFNVPARMKFLKKDQSEAGYVGDVVLRQALAHPEISFTFFKDGKEQYMTPGDGELRSAVDAVLAKDFSKNLLQVTASDGTMSISGLITAPIACRGSRGMQFFYVNGRYVQNTTMTAALEAAYKGVMMQGRFPGCVLNITMPYDKVDVNVHPAKTEVRFANANQIFELVYRAARGSVLSPAAPRREFAFTGAKSTLPILGDESALHSGQPAGTILPSAGNTPESADQTTPAGKEFSVMRNNFTPNENAVFSPKFEKAQGPVPQANSTSAVSAPAQDFEHAAGVLRQDSFVPYYTRRDEPDIERLPTEALGGAEGAKPAFTVPVGAAQPDAATGRCLPNGSKASGASEPPNEVKQQLSMQPQENLPQLRYIGEAFRTYLITECDNELILIDKHAAHERILYEKLVAGYGSANGQLLLAPVTVNLSAEEKNAVLDSGELLEKAGFEMDDFGGSCVVVRSVPAVAAEGDIAALVEEVAHKLTLNAKDTLSEKEDWVLHSVACRAAIKAGDSDRPEALVRLARDILAQTVPPFCPHGRPVLLKLTRKELEKQFGRLG